jgi:hypothetical protein
MVVMVVMVAVVMVREPRGGGETDADASISKRKDPC